MSERKRILVTGANRGLGAAIAETFRRAGRHVTGAARHPETLEGAVDVALPLDLSEPASVAALVEAIIASERPLDLLVNNAGFNPKDRKDDPGYFRSTFAIENFSAANVAESMWINALMPTELVSKLLPALADDAVVLNISSWLGSMGGKTSGGHYGYAGSKALLNMMTRALAFEWHGTGHAAVALNPGWMRTDMGGPKAERSPEGTARDVLELHALGTLHKANGRFIDSDRTDHPW